MTSREKINQIADAFIALQEDRGFKYQRLPGDPVKNAEGIWDVLYHATTASGTLLEGPVVVVVDAVKGAAEFWNPSAKE